MGCANLTLPRGYFEGLDSVRLTFVISTSICVISLAFAGILLYKIRDRKYNKASIAMAKVIVEEYKLPQSKLARPLTQRPVIVYKKNKSLKHILIGRAGSPNILFTVMVGCFFVYIELILMVRTPTRELCIGRMWLRHEGFTFIVLCLIMRQHRIYLIVHQRSWKSQFLREQNYHQTMGVLVGFGTILLIVRTIFIPEIPLVNTACHVVGCTLNTGTYIHIAGELALSVLLLYLCVKTDQVPSPYNDCSVCGFIAYNVIIGTILDTVFRAFGSKRVWQYSLLIISFFRVHSLASGALVGLIGRRVFMVFFPKREMFTTISTVSNKENAHKLRIVLENNGDIKSVTCYPCGPLIVTQSNEPTAPDEDTSRPAERQSQCAGYTEMEIDRLVNLYNAQKQDLKLLHQILERSDTNISPESKLRLSNLNSRFDGSRAFSKPRGLCPGCIKACRVCLTLPDINGDRGSKSWTSDSQLALGYSDSTVETNLPLENKGFSWESLSISNDADGDYTSHTIHA